MAYIPDLAVEMSGTLTPAAFRVYCYVCRRRNHEKRYAWLSLDQLCNALGLSESAVYAATRELVDKAWMDVDGSMLTPKLGDFWPVDKRFKGQAFRDSDWK